MAMLRRPIVTGCAVAAALAADAAPAFAGDSGDGVKIDEDRIVVRVRGGSAVVDRSPFRISFRDAHGRTLLSQVPNARQSARRLPVTLDPEPFALENQPDNATYAPLGYEVGREERFQWNGGLWGGNLLFSRRSGSVHSAHDVLSARRAGRGVRLMVSTSEPGRRLVVKIARDEGAALRVRARPTSKAGVITIGDSFVADPGEGFYGFGGRHGTVEKHGEKLYGWTEQESLGGEPTLRAAPLLPQLVLDGSDFTIDQLGGVPEVPDDLPGGFERYLAVGGPNAAYYPQAQFLSSRGYGFLLNRTELSRWRMGNDRSDAWQVQVAGRKLDYTVTLGPDRERALRTLTDITGRHRLPPRWAQGPTLSRAVSVPLLPGLPPAETTESYRAKVEQDLADIDRYDLRPSAYAFEGWALLQDLDYVRSVIRRLRARGIHSILYHRAYVSNDALNTQPATDFEETMRLGLVAEDASGRPYIFGANGGGPATLLDFTNPATVRWWRERLELLLDAGADGFMQDFGEQVQEDMHFHDGSTGVTMHNRYPVTFHRVSRRIVDDWARRTGREQPWFFTRSGYSGRPGSAEYEMGNFPGDETVDWSAGSGLRSLGPDLLNRAVGGAFGFTTDIGGYADFVTGAPSEELFNRWSEWAALTPYFRVHNSATRGTRMPWSYGPETLARWKALADLHERATPYVRELWSEGRRTGLPPTRPLWLAAPEAPGAARESQEWLLGENVLVAPVVEEGADTRTVSFPRGCWQRQGADGGVFHGPGRATVNAPLGALPYFFRCGTRPF